MKIQYPNNICPSCKKSGNVYAVTDDSPNNIVIFNGCSCGLKEVVYRVNPDGTKINPTQALPTSSQLSTVKTSTVVNNQTALV